MKRVRTLWRRLGALLEQQRLALLWALAAGLLCGLSNIGQPVESGLRTLRDRARPVAASGDIVLVSIDDESTSAVGRWPWPRSKIAGLVDKLRVAGADRVFLDILFTAPSEPTEDKALAKALSKLSDHAYLAGWSDLDKKGLQSRPPVFLSRAEQFSTELGYHAFFGITEVELAGSTDVAGVPTLAARLADAGPSSGSTPIDTAIDMDTIPRISAVAVMDGRVNDLAGKDVVVTTSVSNGTREVFLTSQGMAEVAVAHILAAETLRRNAPVAGGWLPILLLSMIGACCMLGLPRTAMIWLATGISLSILVAGPIFLDFTGIFVDVVPSIAAILVFATGVTARLRRLNRHRAERLHPLTGLPTLLSMRTVEHDDAIAVMRLGHFAEIVAGLKPAQERQLFDELVRRLSLATAGADLFHNDDGVFAWPVDAAGLSEIGDRFDALHVVLRTPVTLGTRRVDLGATFGVAQEASDGIGPRLASAIAAAEGAAQAGARWQRFDASRLVDLEWQLSLLGELDLALDRGDLSVAYQPKLCVATGRWIGAEALARWRHPEKGYIAPDEFIVAAEKSNRIDRLTEFVIDDALAFVKSARRLDPGFTVAVNLSAKLLTSNRIVATVAEKLRRHTVPAEGLMLEITETATMGRSNLEGIVLNQLRALGVSISIDDYGTGFSTLDYMRSVPAGEVKIDRSFVTNIESSQSDLLMVRSTIQLAHSLDRVVVAEGVETEGALRLLEQFGCDIAQGYLISRPVGAEDLLLRIAAANVRDRNRA